MSNKPTILIIDDEEIMREVLTSLMEGEGYRVLSAEDGEEGVGLVQKHQPDLVLLDLMLPGQGGMAVLEQIRTIDPDIVVIMISAFATVETAVEATQSGAYNFVTKPFKNERLRVIIKNGLKSRHLELENRLLKKTLKERHAFQNIIGKSDQIQQVFDLISQVAPGRSTALIVGESGTGKELVAKAIHCSSPRASKAFVAVNSGSIPSELLESELFGHVKGAFTGASSSKKGLFEVADGGTIFLDEVGTLPLDTQAKLLRVIQEREFRRVGGLDNIQVDVRIIAATNIDLKTAVEEQQFREDLYYRLNVIAVRLPPLRERKVDIPLLADHFVRRFCKENDRAECSVDPSVLKLLMEYDWPGNVRELENVMERAVVLAHNDDRITVELLPSEVVNTPLHSASPGLDLLKTGVSLKDVVREFEKNLIVTALGQADWNQKKAASLLGVKPSTLNEKLKRLGIPRSAAS